MRKTAIVIAIEKYSDSEIGEENFASADAIDFARVLEQYGFAAEDQLILIDSQATRTVIQSKLRKRLSSLLSDDILYLYLTGHGFALDRRNFFTCHDTQLDDLSSTSISFEWLFEQFELSPCRQFTLFLDSCATRLLAKPELGATYTELAAGEIKEFFTEAGQRRCFAACTPGEESRSHGSLKHGVWVHHLIRAFNGEAPTALERKVLLTAKSLQNFLNEEVPRTVRALFTGTETQTPWSPGAISSDFPLADLSSILAKRKAAGKSSRNQLKYVHLLHDESRPLRDLSGYIKGHFLPDRANAAAESFVSKIAEKDIDDEINQVHQELKNLFKLKRRDITASVEGGSGSIVTPYFDYEVRVSLNPDNIAEAVFRRQVINIRQPDEVFSNEFDCAFRGKFDRLKFGTNEPLDLERIVDQIEEIESEGLSVTHNKEAELTHCWIHIPGSKVQIEVTPHSFCIMQNGRRAPKELIQAFFDTQELLINTHGLKNLPFQPD